jgi:hypothetical protein
LPVIRNVVVHIANEQPILADLLMDPKPSDVALICSNLRTMGGKKPVFIDKTESTFILPLAHIRFVEISQASMAEAEVSRAADAGRAEAAAGAARRAAEDESYDAVPLARLAWLTSGSGEPPEPADEAEVETEVAVPPNPDEIDQELIRRIHEV